MPAEKGGFIDKWNRETEKLLAQGVEKYEAFERVGVPPCCRHNPPRADERGQTWFHCDDEVIHPPGMAPMQECKRHRPLGSHR
jgi:hypothetical protein